MKNPVDVILASCHSGLNGADYVHLLPKGSKLITFRSDAEEISSAYMIKTAEYLSEQQSNLSEIHTLDILKAYFNSGAWFEQNSYPVINISGYKKELNFADYLSKKTISLQKNDHPFQYTKQGIIEAIEIINNMANKQKILTHSETSRNIIADIFEEYWFSSSENISRNTITKLKEEVYHIVNASDSGNSINEAVIAIIIVV